MSAHRDCVRRRARRSILAIRGDANDDDAVRAVDAVFERCYADLEPVGRLSCGRSCDGLALGELGTFLRAAREREEEKAKKMAVAQSAGTSDEAGGAAQHQDSMTRTWARLWSYWPWSHKS